MSCERAIIKRTTFHDADVFCAATCTFLPFRSFVAQHAETPRTMDAAAVGHRRVQVQDTKNCMAFNAAWPLSSAVAKVNMLPVGELVARMLDVSASTSRF